MPVLSDFNAKTDRKLKLAGTSILTSADVDAFIQEAALAYSRVKPRRLIENVAGDGGFDYVLTGTNKKVTAWSDGFSEIRRLIFPVDDSAQTENVVDEDDFAIVAKLDGANMEKWLRFLADSPLATEKFRITYTAPHTVDAQGSSIPAADEEAVVNKAASLSCEAIAAYYANRSESSLGSDAIDFGDKAEAYQGQARIYRKEYEAHLGIGSEGEKAAAKAASVVSDLDLPPSWSGGRSFLWHGRRRR